jgi:CheY-like chemotaxis protein
LKHASPSARVWLAVAAIGTAAVFLVSYRSVQQNEISAAAVQHTQQTLSALVRLEGTLSDLIFVSGDEAITRASDAAVNRIDACDILLVDIAMPHEDGYMFIRRLRTDGVRQPVAALTALAHETDRARALESGFDAHIQKPVEPRALAKAVASLVSTRVRPELKAAATLRMR